MNVTKLHGNDPKDMTIKMLTLIALVQVLACEATYAASYEETSIDFDPVIETSPYVLETVTPKYPRELFERGVQGRTLLMLRVDDRGKVSGVHVVSASNKAFADEAIKSVKKWYFQPGTRDGQAVQRIVMLPVNFLIEDLQRPSLASL